MGDGREPVAAFLPWPVTTASVSVNYLSLAGNTLILRWEFWRL